MKLIIGCKSAAKDYAPFTEDEIVQHEIDMLAAEERALLDQLIPTLDEIEQAEFELKTITLLMEVGLI